jgi:hypothetical protein
MFEFLEFLSTHYFVAVIFLFGLIIITHFLYKVIKEFLNFVEILIKGQPTINNYKEPYDSFHNNAITNFKLDDSKKK